MNATRSFWIVAVPLILTVALTGCHRKNKDPAPEPPQAGRNPLAQDPAGGAPANNDVQRGAQLRQMESLMKDIGTYYELYRTENGRPPRTFQEFKDYVKADPNARNLAAAFDRDWLVMVLDPPPNANQVLAYEKEPYKKWHNRVVLRGDGSVKLMDESEFQAALKGQ